jgi:hypothetical protein
MSHRGHPACPHATKGACDKAKREALGRCVEMTQAKEPTQCRLWASSIVEGRPMCNAHAGAVLERHLEERRKADRASAWQARVTAFMDWTAEHPSVHDRMPG